MEKKTVFKNLFLFFPISLNCYLNKFYYCILVSGHFVKEAMAQSYEEIRKKNWTTCQMIRFNNVVSDDDVICFGRQ